MTAKGSKSDGKGSLRKQGKSRKNKPCLWWSYLTTAEPPLSTFLSRTNIPDGQLSHLRLPLPQYCQDYPNQWEWISVSIHNWEKILFLLVILFQEGSPMSLIKKTFLTLFQVRLWGLPQTIRDQSHIILNLTSYDKARSSSKLFYFTAEWISTWMSQNSNTWFIQLSLAIKVTLKKHPVYRHASSSHCVPCCAWNLQDTWHFIAVALDLMHQFWNRLAVSRCQVTARSPSKAAKKFLVTLC